MSTTERWLPVPGHPDYEVSDAGRVMSHRGQAPRELAGSHNQRGYRLVQMRRPDGGMTARTVHRLVALAFIGEPPAGMQACHNDGDKSNNAVSNLRYDTASANTLDQVRHGVHNNARKTHCGQGHEYTPENTKRAHGRRYCLACIEDRRLARADAVEVAA